MSSSVAWFQSPIPGDCPTPTGPNGGPWHRPQTFLEGCPPLSHLWAEPFPIEVCPLPPLLLSASWKAMGMDSDSPSITSSLGLVHFSVWRSLEAPGGPPAGSQR